MKKNKKKVSSKRKRSKKTSAKERLLYYLENKYTANLEPGPAESSLTEKKDEADVNPNR